MREKKRTNRHLRWPAFLCAALLLALAAFFMQDAVESVERMAYPRKYSEYVTYYADKYKLDENRVYAIIRTESGFSPDARSNVGALGLMQITEETFSWIKSKIAPNEEIDFESLTDPETNIRFGVYLLAVCLHRYEEDFATAAAAYHSGMGLVDGLLESPDYSADGRTLHTFPYSQMGHYVDKVSQSYAKYTALYAG